MVSIGVRIHDLEKQQASEGVFVKLARRAEGQWEELGSKFTGKEGESGNLLPNGFDPYPGVYRLRLETGAYFRREKKETFFSHIDVHFLVKEVSIKVFLEISPSSYQVRK